MVVRHLLPIGTQLYAKGLFDAPDDLGQGRIVEGNDPVTDQQQVAHGHLVDLELLGIGVIDRLLSGMQAGVGAVIASVTYDMGAPIVKEKDPMSLVIMLGAFLAACILEINVIYIVIVCGLLGVVRTLLAKRRAGK